MPVAHTEVQPLIFNQILEILQKDDFMEETTITLETRLVGDLNFASMDFIELVVGIESGLQQKLGFHELLMSEEDYVSDLTVERLIEFVESKLTATNTEKAEASQTTRKIPQSDQIPEKVISLEEVHQFRQAVDNKVVRLFSSAASLSVPDEAISSKNRPAIFILSPPRSGSTLLRVILAGHQKLFAPPELHLLSYPTLIQRNASLSNESNQHLLQGTIRAIMQLKSCTVEQARQMMQNYENRGLTTKEFYHILQQQLGDKILVDKTPTYATSLGILKRAESYFENPLYIHLCRHPYAMIRSYEDAKLERIIPFMNESSFSRKELAELTWLVSHDNIIKFLQDIPQQRQFRLKFEDLASHPQEQVEQLCDFIGIDFQTEMLQPYREKEQRMTDGLESVSQMSGDLKFFLHQGIDPNIAFRWKKYHTHDFLCDSSWQLAEKLGYNKD